MPPKLTLKDPNHPLRKLGRSLAQVGLTTLGASVAGPFGVAAAREIGDALGLPGKLTQEKLNLEIEKELATNPDALIALRQIEAETIAARLTHEQVLAQHEVSSIEAVNETMRAEVAAVLTNPQAGSWRPLWGRWTCYNFFAIIWGMLALTAGCVVTGNIEALPGLATIFSFMIGAITLLPGAILGVASLKRGTERIEMAKGLVGAMQGPFNNR